MSLRDYKRKRDFAKTSEPSGTRTRRPTVGKSEGLFVIQKHAARRLHYDFRLELGGTLKSWAVPKGPSLNPADKRLAVHVEDHPMEYADFEGIIPARQYGAGTVMVWDRGEWIPDGDPTAAYKKGHLKFTLWQAKNYRAAGPWCGWAEHAIRTKTTGCSSRNATERVGPRLPPTPLSPWQKARRAA